MIERVVLDSNVLISALIWGGKPAEIIELCIKGDIELFLSQPIINETLRVLKRKGLDDSQLAEALEFITLASTLVTPVQQLHIVIQDPDDNKVLECAVSAKADAIISGDKHLLRLRGYNSIPILKVADFLLEKRKNSD